MATNNIVLIHGLWMTPLSWENWTHLYTGRGYNVFAPCWPGMDRDIRALRREPGSYAALSIGQIVDHHERLVLELEEPPILIGHGFGGFVVQALLDRGLGSCGVTIASAPIKGIWTLPYSTMRVVTSQLLSPVNGQRGVPLNEVQFRYAFMNTSTPAESLQVYQRHAVPAPQRVLLQAELANFNPFAETAVNVRRNNRAPLLMIAGARDHVTPPSLISANVKAYRHSIATTEYKEFPGRTHFIIGQRGWQEVADFTLDWARDQELLVEREQRRVARELHSRAVA
jgi:pimeloyl-ACP methyl ester carboxylesterase